MPTRHVRLLPRARCLMSFSAIGMCCRVRHSSGRHQEPLQATSACLIVEGSTCSSACKLVITCFHCTLGNIQLFSPSVGGTSSPLSSPSALFKCVYLVISVVMIGCPAFSAFHIFDIWSRNISFQHIVGNDTFISVLN
jgi:hypothetical protein